MENLAVIFEIFMILMFGASWPFNIVKAYKARTAKGTSPLFLSLIGFGYVCGIVSKLCAFAYTGTSYWTFLHILAFVFYIINFCMITTAVIIYFRNRKEDAKRA